MRQYLANIHTRSEHHKKRFALLTSASFTLAIFAFWSLTTFDQGTVAEVPNQNDVAASREVSPFQSLLGGVAASFQALRGDYSELKEGLEVVNFEAENPNY